jgi:uncharacterized protein (DUF1501 family)
MFSIFGAAPFRTGHSVSRRDFLRVGSLALGGLTLPQLLAARAKAGQARRFVKDKSVVLLFLQGGPPQGETFDPKLDGPADVKSVTGDVPTALAGVRFGGTFPKLARLADKLAIVRSFAAGKGGLSHEAGYTSLLTAANALEAPLGALYARTAEPIHPRTGMPVNQIVLPEAIRPDLKLGNPSGAFTYQQTMRYFGTAGKLGPACEPFNPSGGGQLLNNLKLQLPQNRFDDRRTLLTQLDSLKRDLDRTGDLAGIDAFQQQAYDVLLRGISEAFDLSKEDARTRERYDTSKLFRMEDLHRGGPRFKPNFSRTTNLLGKQMLLARRLCEAGCGFVTVVDSCWDFHADGNNPPASVGMPILGPQLDHAVAAFLEDVAERGLSDKILLIITGEMGRTPKKAGNGGTGHWGDLTPLVLAGGGLKMGQVIGRSDRLGAFPATERYTPQHLLATVMETLFDLGEVRVTRDVPKNVVDVVTGGTPIRELF